MYRAGDRTRTWQKGHLFITFFFRARTRKCVFFRRVVERGECIVGEKSMAVGRSGCCCCWIAEFLAACAILQSCVPRRRYSLYIEWLWDIYVNRLDQPKVLATVWRIISLEFKVAVYLLQYTWTTRDLREFEGTRWKSCNWQNLWRVTSCRKNAYCRVALYSCFVCAAVIIVHCSLTEM